MSNQLAPNNVFLIVKEILQLISRFQTPATPEVYEVWYQYVQKLNPPLVEALDYAIKEERCIDGPMLLALRHQYCSFNDDTADRVQSSLVSELSSIQSVVTDHMDAGSVFAVSLSDAAQSIDHECQTKEQLSACAASLSVATTKMSKQLESLMKRLEEADARVECLKEELAESQREMMQDPMTGIGNRRFFDSMLRRFVHSKEQKNGVCCLAIIDMDKFKNINDTHGHDVGDDVICYLATKITALLPLAEPARLGGDEFALFLRTETLTAAVSMMEEFLMKLFLSPMQVSGTGQLLGKAGISIGLAVLRDTDDETSWYRQADKHLYEAKRRGGNRVVSERDLR